VIPLDPFEEAILDRALLCNRMRTPVDRAFLRKLLTLEERFAVPRTLRGMLLAAACHESGFDASNEGDHKFSHDGRPKAIGLLQMWPWWEDHYKIDRRDPKQAAIAWLTHITEQLNKTRAACGYRKGSERLWVAAWVRAVRAPPTACLRASLRAKGVLKPKERGGSANYVLSLARKHLTVESIRSCQRCYQKPKHYKRLKRWRKLWDHLMNPLIRGDTKENSVAIRPVQREGSAKSQPDS
jgi:hypothetical protein